MATKIHPRIRLRDHSPYKEPGRAIHVWFGPKDRSKRIFAIPRAAEIGVDVLIDVSDFTGVPIYMFAVMPDHVHLVLSPSERCEMKDFVSRYKNAVRTALKVDGIMGLSWQKHFGDRVIRNSGEPFNRVCAYVLHNAVKDELVMRWQDYPYCGSLVFDLE